MTVSIAPLLALRLARPHTLILQTRRTLSSTMGPKRKASEATSTSASETSEAAAQLEAGGSSQKKTRAAPKVKAVPKAKKAPAAPFPRPSSEPVYPSTSYLNKALPETWTLPAKVADIKITSWNITSLKSVCDTKHGGSGPLGAFGQYLDREDADIVILTETKRNDGQPIPQDPALKAKYPYQKWAYSTQKGYAGTAILSRIPPLSSYINLVVKEETITGRLVGMEFPTFHLIGTYAPNASEKLKNMQGKIDWNEAFEAKLRELDATKPVVWGGDINVCASGRDISDPEKGWNKLPGFTQQELEGFMSQLNPSPGSGHRPLVDAWRELKGPDLVEYSFHSKRVLQREKGKGWRLDTFVVSERLMERVKACEIRREIFGPSDHVPVVVELSGEA